MAAYGRLDSTAIIRRALEQTTLAHEIKENPAVDGEYIERRILGAEREILAQAQPQISAYEKATQAYGAALADESRRAAPPGYVAFAQLLPGLAILLGIVAAIAWLILSWTAPARRGALQQRLTLWMSAWGWVGGRTIGLVLLVALIVLVATSIWWWITRRPLHRGRARTAAGVDAASKEAEVAGEAAEAAVFRAATEMALSIVNDASTPFFQRELRLEDAPGPLRKTADEWLSEVTSATNEVPTAARRRIVEMMQRLPGLALGVSGPRGVGKSTLLGSIAGSPPELDGRPAVVVYTSAPVEYESREFLLHLYGSLCRTLLARLGISEALALQQAREAARARSVDQLQLGWLTSGLGIVLGAISIVLTQALAQVPAVGEHLPPTRTQHLLQVLDLKTGTLVIWSICAVLAGATIVLMAPLPLGDAEERGQASNLLRIVRRLGRRPSLRTRRPEHTTAFGERCIREYADIRFQRTYTSGWSGSLTMPAAATFGRTQGLSMAESAASLPELVQRFRALARDTAREVGRVIICIDELDKLKSGELAYRFVDEVKSIFNIEHCYYLVSVSENAISNFDRRGMPFRDAFDSAFDDMLYIDYLGLDGSRQLLNRRVLNLPGPFLCLCHVLSGGLPRDLIRITRKILDLARDGQAGRTLASLSAHMFRAELADKCRAISIASREIRLEPEVTAFLVTVAQIEALDPVAGRLAGPLSLTVEARDDLTDDERASHRRLAGLAIELAAFVQFAFTAAPIFQTFDQEAAWRKAVDDGLIARLTAARQALEFGVGVALFRTADIRRTEGLPELSLLVDGLRAGANAGANPSARLSATK
jgi:hypothetical protein